LKIALLISGLARNWKPCLQSQLDTLSSHDVDVFFYFWDTHEKQNILDLLKPRSYAFARPLSFSSFDTHPGIRADAINVPSRMMSQYYAWLGAGVLFSAVADEYDVAIRTRSDLQFVEPVNDIIKSVSENTLILPWAEPDKYLSDLCCIGSPKAVIYYHALYDSVMEYAREILFNPELLLARHLQLSPYDIYTDDTLNSRYFVRRPHMNSLSLSECLKQQAGKSKWLDPEIIESHAERHGSEYVQAFADNQIKLMREQNDA
jgi:hypothetical protein